MLVTSLQLRVQMTTSTEIQVGQIHLLGQQQGQALEYL